MQKVITKEIKIISNWQMYQDCGVNVQFLYEDIGNEPINIYFPYSIKAARKNADWFFFLKVKKKRILKKDLCL